ncbi:MAG: hypothetical protein Q9196_007031, partial [Gyalolechia fulgens]
MVRTKGHPSAPFHKCRPLDGPTLFEVLPGNIKQWRTAIRNIVDLKQLGIRLCVAYDGYPQEESFSVFQRTLTTEVSEAEKARKRSPTQLITDEAAWGVPPRDSSDIWILTAWTTWNNRDEYFVKTHTRKYTEHKMQKSETQELYMFHAGLVIVDEAHRVVTPDTGQ